RHPVDGGGGPPHQSRSLDDHRGSRRAAGGAAATRRAPPEPLVGRAPMKLVLFDVDGTLLSASGAGRRSLERALRAGYGTAGPIDRYDFRGGTDLQIVRDLMRLAGLHADAVRAGETQVLDRYAICLDEEVGDGRGVRLYPGVRAIVERLDRTEGCL